MSEKAIFKSEAGRKAILAAYDSVLERWPVPCETLTVPTRYGQTFMLASGPENAPPLILLHGSSTNSAMWIGDVAEYSRHYRVYAADIPGEPGKSEAVRSEINGPFGREWLQDVLDALQVGQTYLLGISMGGWIALQFAGECPERVKRLALLCPGGVSPPKVSFTLRVIPFLFLGEWGLERITRLVNGSQEIAEEAVEYTKLIGRNFNPRMEGSALIPDEVLKRVTMPVLLIVGEKDALLDSRKTAARLAALLPRLMTEMLPDAGHVLINLSDKVLAFLSDRVLEKSY